LDWAKVLAIAFVFTSRVACVVGVS
jgi:hypothetical protein